MRFHQRKGQRKGANALILPNRLTDDFDWINRCLFLIQHPDALIGRNEKRHLTPADGWIYARMDGWMTEEPSRSRQPEQKPRSACFTCFFFFSPN